MKEKKKKEKIKWSEEIQINFAELHLECQKQAKLSASASKELARLTAEHSTLENQLELETARLERLIRTSPDKYGITMSRGTIREGDIKARVVTDETIKQLKADIIQKKFDLDVMKGLTTLALPDKKKMLEQLIQLLHLEYFSTPKGP